MKWKTASRHVFRCFIMLVALTGVMFGVPAVRSAEQQVAPNDIKQLESFVTDTERSLQELVQNYKDLRLVLAHSEPPWPQLLEVFDARMDTTASVVMSTTQAVREFLNAKEQITPARVGAAFKDVFAADMVILEHYLFLIMNIDSLTGESNTEQHTE